MGKIKVKVHPNSSRSKIEKIKENEYEMWISEKPINNKANSEVLKMLKKYFKKDVVIKSGFKSKNKIVEILENSQGV